MQEMLQALACLEECTHCDEANTEEWLRIDASDPGCADSTNPEVAITDDGDSDELPDVQLTPSHTETCEMLKKCIL